MSKLCGKLQTALSGPTSGQVSIHIILEEQIDFDRWESDANHKRYDLSSRQSSLIRELKDISQNTGNDLFRFLLDSKMVDSESITRRWVVNAISCKADIKVVPLLAARKDVKWIGLNSQLKPTFNITETVTAMPVPDKAEKGLKAIGADLMWKLGYTGYGRLVFVPDTGTDPTHPAIARQYNGLYNGDKSSWYTQQNNSPIPKDCDRHGTHVTGTILGLDKSTNDTLGVAFNARWMAGGILCGIGSEDNLGAFEWALDPDGNPETTNDIPDVINNSWYDPEVGANECYSAYEPLLRALELAGVAVVFSAGNEGPEAGTITPPHNININIVNSFTVGALNGNVPTYPIASFSSIGPSKCPGEGSIKIKPEVSAPGVQVRSCVPGNEYAFLSGTSMAAPHVSGAILLLKEAFPYLGGRELKLALYETAIDLGEPGEDNKFGTGIINVYQAYLKLVGEGHVPVPGQVRRDALLLDIKSNALACNRTFAPELLVENAGTDTIMNLQFQIVGTSINRTLEWTGSIPPAGQEVINLETSGLPEEDETVRLAITSVNGTTDERDLNNFSFVRIRSTARLPLVPADTFTLNICKGTQVYVERPASTGVTISTVKWYDGPHDGNLLHEGQRLLVDNNIKGDVYAELGFRDRLSGEVHSQGDITYPDLKGEGLIFDADGPFTLDSVSVYSKETGIRDFYLYNERGDSITSSRKFINKVGINNIKLGWEIPAGINYRIVKASGKPLGIQSGIQGFPINSSDNIVSIKAGTDGDNYHMFYNWRISYNHPCGRIRYPIHVKADSVAGTIQFELSKDTLWLPDQSTLSIKDESSGLESYQWSMGDGKTYTSRDVIHTYEKEGSYVITLKARDANGCTMEENTGITVLVTVASSDPSPQRSGLTIRPNPARDNITVSIPAQLASHDGQLTIIDGRGVLQKKLETGGKTEINLDISELMPGLYYLKPSTKMNARGISFIKIR